MDPFDILMNALEEDSATMLPGGSSSSGSDGEEHLSSMIVSSNHDSTTTCTRNSNEVLETMSLNSETLQDFGSLVTLEGTVAGLFRSERDDNSSSIDGEHTIVSSAPSGATIPPPEPSSDIFAISPHPRMVVATSNHSLSTVCTDTISYTRMLDDLDDDDESNNNISSSPQNQRALVPFSGGSATEADIHDPVSFVAVANRLMGDSIGGRRNTWFDRFTEQDWEQFRQIADMILQSIEPPPKLLPLPPSPPALPALIDPTIGSNIRSYNARDMISECHVCTICKDVVVGALTLDCGCSLPTVCTSCWESTTNQNSALSNELGFVMVEQRRRYCPSCSRPVTSSIPSKALDVAILHIVQNLDCRDVGVCSVQQSYYLRLEAWRSNIEDLNAINNEAVTARRDALLAELIAQEEAYFWKDQDQQIARKRREAARTTNILVFGQTAIALIAATLASAGISAIVSRR